MSNLRFARYMLCSCVVAVLLSGCGVLRQAQDDTPPIGAPGTMPQDRAIATDSAHGGSSTLATASGLVKGRLLIADSAGEDVVVLKNNSWIQDGTITNGIEYPVGTWVDTDHNFYAADAASGDITEYNNKGTLIHTYTGMNYPIALTTDRKGNVYAAEWLGHAVDEYRRGHDVRLATCSIDGDPKGVAVDKKGDVFVAYTFASGGGGGIIELNPGLSNCSETVLGVSLNTPGGMALDRNNNIVVCEEGYSAVAIVDPPYSQIAGYLGSGYALPTDVKIDKANTLAYVTDYENQQVLVLDYPSGSTVKVLNYSYGIETPMSAVDGSNYVP